MEQRIEKSGGQQAKGFQLPVVTHWLRERSHDLLPSTWEVERRSLAREHLTREDLVSGALMQELSLIDGNFWQLSDRNDDELSGGIRAQWKSGRHSWVGAAATPSEPTAGHAVHRDRDILVLGGSLMGPAPGTLPKATMAWRQRGQAIEPGGPGTTVDVLFVEQRYRAHLVQNSWPQPAKFENASLNSLSRQQQVKNMELKS